ncbi:hypothetical protein SAY87_017930 [Trapa incisa]|uniref:Uncharacterized protein n=1 Tax=Trapa incisa TaxID=236973 RepID=A0AAN7L7F1_9MYRT|nr:hypothetical protein SAY87_017930 [Trapa incisa]
MGRSKLVQQHVQWKESKARILFEYFRYIKKKNAEKEHPSFTENERTWISLGIEILVPFWPLASLDRTMHVGHVLLVKDAAPFAAWGHFSNCGSWKWNC